MKTKQFIIAVCGGQEGKHLGKALPLARGVGRAVALAGHTTLTGATNGVPLAAARAAKDAGGKSLGMSPLKHPDEKIFSYNGCDDPSAFDHIIYTGAGLAKRDLLMVDGADAAIFIDGRIGTLNEFTFAYEANKVIGVLEGSGGVTDEIRRLLTVADKGFRKAVFDTDPERLVEKVIAKIKEEKRS